MFDCCTNTRRDRPRRAFSAVSFHSAVSEAWWDARRLLARPASSRFTVSRRARVLLLRSALGGGGRVPSRCAFPGPSPVGGAPPGAPVAVCTPPAPSPGPTSSVSTTHSLHFSRPDHSVEVFILEHRKPAEKINKSKHRLLEKIDETDMSLG